MAVLVSLIVASGATAAAFYLMQFAMLSSQAEVAGACGFVFVVSFAVTIGVAKLLRR